MKKLFIMLLALSLCTSVLCACSKTEPTPETPTGNQTENDTEAGTLPETEPPLPAIDPATLGACSAQYTTSVGSVLESWENTDADTFHGVCRFYETSGYTLYQTNDMNGNLASTYEKDGEIKHVYYQPARHELNISTDPAGVSSLPPKEPETVTGSTTTTVTQVSAKEINGMGYVIQLADGTFIVYDGGYESGVAELWDTLVTLNGGDENIHIRMWILTHSHDDHYPCSLAFLRNKKTDNVRVDYLMYCPVNENDVPNSSGSAFFCNNLPKRLSVFTEHGAQVVIAHTGMSFRFCNVTLEILSTADEMYIEDTWSNFNNSSIVSRITTDNGHSMIFLADAARAVGDKMIELYGTYLKSDMCQIAHHGVEDYPLEAYHLIAAGILFYPCSQSLYDLPNRDADVRAALREAEYVKEILIRDHTRFTRNLDGE